MNYSLICAVFAWLRSMLKTQRALALEDLALRQQVVMLKRSVKRPRTTPLDRLFWIVFARTVDDWRGKLFALSPDTVVRWHREGFRRYWRWKSRRIGRPRVDIELRRLIRQMQRENVTWGAPRIHGELLKLGYELCEATVSKVMSRYRKPPSQSLRTFLCNHHEELVAIDFFTVPTVSFKILYVFVVMEHSRRRVVHWNVTAHPTSRWTAQQIIEAFPFATAPKYLIRDGDGIYGAAVSRRIESLGISEQVTTPASPWENAYAERVIGSIRRECLDHLIVLNERHLRGILKGYLNYYDDSRTHLSLAKDSPRARAIESCGAGNVVPFPLLGGLHHRYKRIAA
jgi:putative transposase